jgi:hypothetical protein
MRDNIKAYEKHEANEIKNISKLSNNQNTLPEGDKKVQNLRILGDEVRILIRGKVSK